MSLKTAIDITSLDDVILPLSIFVLPLSIFVLPLSIFVLPLSTFETQQSSSKCTCGTTIT